MFAKDFRKAAWFSLNGKWGTMALITLVMSLIMGALSALSSIGVGAVVLLLVEGPLTLGYAICALTVIRNQEVKLDNLFIGFKNFLRAFVLSLLIAIFTALWMLLLVVPGIIKSLSYSMSYFILADNPDMDANEARVRSMELMNGYKWRLFCLSLSFIGWNILCMLTFGILSFWVIPYQRTAYAEFYRNILAEKYPVSEIPAEPVAPAAAPVVEAEPMAESEPEIKE